MTDESRTDIRFLKPEEQFKVCVARQEQHYCEDVAVRRGFREVIFVWKASMNANGNVVMGVIPVAIPNRAQLGHGASRGDNW